MNQHHYNTTALRGKDLFTADRKAQGQEDYILESLRMSKAIFWTARTIRKLYMPDAEMSTISRIIRNLTEQGKLVKSSDTIIGDVGARVHYWKLNQSYAIS